MFRLQLPDLFQSVELPRGFGGIEWDPAGKGWSIIPCVPKVLLRVGRAESPKETSPCQG